MSQTLNVAPYDNALSSLTGGRRRKGRKGSKGSKGRKSRRTQSRNRNQAGGLFPGLGGIVHQALVPFGLYAMQHSLKNRSRGHVGSSSGISKKYGRFRRTSRRS